ncbi:MAG: PH domain-containing protein [Kosmotogaceae bacterium]
MEFFELGTVGMMGYLGYGVVILIGIILLVSLFLTSGRKRIYVSVFLAGMLVFMYVLLIYGPSKSGVVVNSDSLVVRISAFREFNVNREDIKDMFVVDLNEDDQYRPSLKTFGTAIGDYRTGNFRLKNGESARFVANGTNVLVIELEDSYAILAPKDFENFMKAMNNKFGSFFNN